MKNWLKAQRLQISIRYGRWAYLIAGLCLGAILFSGTSIADSIQLVEQGRGGKYGPWLVNGTVSVYGPDGGVGTLPVVTNGFSTATTSEALVGVGPTAMPLASGTKSQILQNLGPNSIYCSTAINGSANADAGLDDAGAFLGAGGVSIPSGASATFDTTLQIYCVSTVLQVAGLGTRVVDLNEVDTARLSAAGSGGGGATAYDVAIPAKVSLSANVSGSICSLTPLATYRISCDAAASFRTGAATPTALSTDSALFANTIMDVKLGTAKTCFAFISTSAVDCRAALLTP
jgi:hypothetical protein